MSIFRRFWSCFDYKIGFLHHLSSTLKSILLLFFKVTCLYILTYLHTNCQCNILHQKRSNFISVSACRDFGAGSFLCEITLLQYSMHAVSLFCSNFSQLYSMTEYCLTYRVIDNLRVRAWVVKDTYEIYEVCIDYLILHR